MPELPEVEAVRRTLEPVLTGARIVDVEVRRPNLRTAFPPRFRERLAGCTVVALRRRAKYLLAALSSGETLVMHLGMSGSFAVAPPAVPGEDPDRRGQAMHDHVVFHLDSGAAIVFNDPRRFGFMDLLAPEALASHPALSGLGPEPLSDEFDAAVLARACAGKRTAIKLALLDQRVVAGLGNIYACEALHLARLSPFRKAATIGARSAPARERAERLAAAIKTVLDSAIRRNAAPYRTARFRVYDREGHPCPRRSCGGTIRRRTQSGRSTFYCPVCQR
jgi:formamidopyrimidine-DNA glycosylase